MHKKEFPENIKPHPRLNPPPKRSKGKKQCNGTGLLQWRKLLNNFLTGNNEVNSVSVAKKGYVDCHISLFQL